MIVLVLYIYRTTNNNNYALLKLSFGVQGFNLFKILLFQ